MNNRVRAPVVACGGILIVLTVLIYILLFGNPFAQQKSAVSLSCILIAELFSIGALAWPKPVTLYSICLFGVNVVYVVVQFVITVVFICSDTFAANHFLIAFSVLTAVILIINISVSNAENKLCQKNN